MQRFVRHSRHPESEPLPVLMFWTVSSRETAQSAFPREGKQIFEGALASLKRFKDDVKEVKAGYECGLVFDKFNDTAGVRDQVEAYIMVRGAEE